MRFYWEARLIAFEESSQGYWKKGQELARWSSLRPGITGPAKPWWRWLQMPYLRHTRDLDKVKWKVRLRRTTKVA